MKTHLKKASQGSLQNKEFAIFQSQEHKRHIRTENCSRQQSVTCDLDSSWIYPRPLLLQDIRKTIVKI